jgi:uncharacterized protein YlxW (UPF0749 family)
MRRASGRLAVAIVLAVLGFLVVVQLHSQATDQGLAALSVQDLTELVANLTARNNQLRQEIATLDDQHRTLASALQNGDTSTTGIRNDLSHILAWSGALGVRGAGVEVSVRGAIPADALNGLINELRNAGAEAISVGGVRLVPGVVVDGDPGSLSVVGVPLADPAILLAVGQPETLAGSLSRAGGLIAQMAARYPDAVVTVVSLDLVDVPATDRDLSPVLGTPRL